MPLAHQVSLNPNDNQGRKKKQYTNVNQHYISHNAVIPPYDLEAAMDRMGRGHNASEQPVTIGTPYKDPYAAIPLKPNQMPRQQASQIYGQI